MMRMIGRRRYRGAAESEGLFGWGRRIRVFGVPQNPAWLDSQAHLEQHRLAELSAEDLELADVHGDVAGLAVGEEGKGGAPERRTFSGDGESRSAGERVFSQLMVAVRTFSKRVSSSTLLANLPNFAGSSMVAGLFLEHLRKTVRQPRASIRLRCRSRRPRR